MEKAREFSMDLDLSLPHVLPIRQRAELVNALLKERLEAILPMAMREGDLDLWLILCQEDNLDPIFRTLIPVDTWCPILQILVFYDRGEGEGVERINISGTKTHDFYDRPYRGQVEEKQWSVLMDIVEERDPQRIGINIGSTQWAAGGLSHNLYLELTDRLPEKYHGRLVSAEKTATRWAATLTDGQIEGYQHVVHLAHYLIAECYSRKAVIPGVTTVTDLEWYYWQRSAELGLSPSFKPSFRLVRSPAMRDKHGVDDSVIRAGDFIHCDVGIRYLGLCTDHQQWAYVRCPGEAEAPEGMRQLLADGNRLQDIFMSEFKHGLTGNQLLANILSRARHEDVPGPRVYSHSLGLFLHEPGPLIGLPWEQDWCAGRGDVPLKYGYAFTMELSVKGAVSEWDDEEISLGLEEDVYFDALGCRPLNGRQTEFYLV